MHRGGIVRSKKHGSTCHLFRVKKIAAGWRHCTHQANIIFVAGPPQMCVQRRCDITRGKRVDIDIVAAELNGQRFGQKLQTAFGCAISRAIGERADAGDGGNVDHLAAAVATKLRQQWLDAKKRSLEVEVKLLIPDRLGGFLHWYGTEHTSVVDQNIDATERLQHLCDHSLDLRYFRAIGKKSTSLAPRIFNTADNLFGFVAAFAAYHGDTCALGAVAYRDRLSDTLRATGNDGNLALQFHCLSSRIFSVCFQLMTVFPAVSDKSRCIAGACHGSE